MFFTVNLRIAVILLARLEWIEVVVNPDKFSSHETDEDVQQDEDPVRTTPEIWLPTPSPEVKREENPINVEAEIQSPIAAESAAPLSSELAFACLLIPRFPDHFLVGDIVDCLTDWMKKACISYGWRLGSIAVRPGNLQWVMHVPLNANPAQFMRLIRRYTSEKIFEDFPRFRQQNISNEFWAPGNFVTPGNQLPTREQVHDYMVQTRRSQGIV